MPSLPLDRIISTMRVLNCTRIVEIIRSKGSEGIDYKVQLAIEYKEKHKEYMKLSDWKGNKVTPDKLVQNHPDIIINKQRLKLYWTNWRRRGDMVKFLQGCNFLEKNNSINNNLIFINNSIQERVLSLRIFYENITSYL